MAIDPAYLLGLPPRITTHAYAARDTMLYALGIGAGSDPADLRYVYEDSLQALPTMAVVLGYPGFWQKELQYGIDWTQLLHAEQSLILHAALPVSGVARGETVIDAIVDKGAAKGALMGATRRVYDDATGRLLATVRQTSFLRGDGGCGGSSGSLPPPHPMPATLPDVTTALATRPEQALLYRLSGDYNPLHADPAVARRAGLDAPILHGLCTFGIAGRALIRGLCANDAARLRRIDCRFTAPVYPGETLRVGMWRESTGQAAFRVTVEERDRVVLDHGYAEYEEG